MKHIDTTRAIYEPGADPLDYPSSIPARPVLVRGDEAMELCPSTDFRTFFGENGINVDALLAQNGLAPVADRIAQIAFGAHRNIENIAWKLANHARTARPGLSRDFLIVPGYVKNADVVACNVSSGGHMYSGLLATRDDLPFRQYLLGTKCPVALLLLDRKQMIAMHEMAGIPKGGEGAATFHCDLATMAVHLDDVHACAAQTYSVAVPFLSLDGRPLAFAAVSTMGRADYPALSQRDMFRAINRVIAAEPDRDGVTPIIDTVNRRRRALMAEGPGEMRRIAQDVLFASVKEALATTYALRDEDGKVRRGLEDVAEFLTGNGLWQFGPLYRPAPMQAARS